MAEVNAQETTRTLIAYTIATDRGALVSLLQRNGIVLPANASDREVTIATLQALKSQSFKSDMTNLLGRKVSDARQDFAQFTGVDDFGGIDDFFSASAEKAQKRAAAKTARVTAANPQGKTGAGLFLQNLGKSLGSQETINQGLNVGLTALNNRVQAKSNTLTNEANTIIQKSDEITRQIPTNTKKDNTLTYVFVGVGVLALIGIVYFVAKKK